MRSKFESFRKIDRIRAPLLFLHSPEDEVIPISEGRRLYDAATGQGLLNYFLRAINCRALTEEEAQNLTSLTLEELRGGSFVKILKNRQT